MTKRSEGQSRSWTTRYQCQYPTISPRCLHKPAHSLHRSTDQSCLSIGKGQQTCSAWCIEDSGSQRNSRQVGGLCRSKPLFSDHYRNQSPPNCTHDRLCSQRLYSSTTFRSKCQVQTGWLAQGVVLTSAFPQVLGFYWARQALPVALLSSRGLDQWCSRAEEACHLLFCMGFLPIASSTLLERYCTILNLLLLTIFSDFYLFLFVVFRTEIRNFKLIILAWLCFFRIWKCRSVFSFCTSCRNQWSGCCRIQLWELWSRSQL